jgi:hypothetical protein
VRVDQLGGILLFAGTGSVKAKTASVCHPSPAFVNLCKHIGDSDVLSYVEFPLSLRLNVQQFNRGLFDYLIATDAVTVPKQQPAADDTADREEQPTSTPAAKGKQPGSRKRRTPSDERDAEFSVTRCRTPACYNNRNRLLVQ